MSRKRTKAKRVAEAVPDEILAEGSGKTVAAASEPEPLAVAEAIEQPIEASDELAPSAPLNDELATNELAQDALANDALANDALEASADGEVALEASDGEVALEASVDGEVALVDEATDDEIVEEIAGATLPTSAATMDPVQLKHLVEALVFAADKPLTLQRLRQLTRVSEVRRLEQALAELAADYQDRGLILQQVSGGFQFRTRTQFSAWVQQLIAGRPVRLSRAQLESLAIIAYRQPITRPEIDEIRGVDSSATLKLLMDRSLIRILGKREEVGRPMLYGTTREFLDFFSLGDLRELPTLREYSELTDESRKVVSDRLGVGLEPAAEPNVIFDDSAAEVLFDATAKELDDTEAEVLFDDTSVVADSVIADRAADEGLEVAAVDDAVLDDAMAEPAMAVAAESPMVDEDADEPVMVVAAESPMVDEDAGEPVMVVAAESPMVDEGAREPAMAEATSEPAMGALAEPAIALAEPAMVDGAAADPTTELSFGKGSMAAGEEADLESGAIEAHEHEAPRGEELGDADALASIASRVLAKADAAEAAALEAEQASVGMAEDEQAAVAMSEDAALADDPQPTE